jgi:hypothetical protein
MESTDISAKSLKEAFEQCEDDENIKQLKNSIQQIFDNTVEGKEVAKKLLPIISELKISDDTANKSLIELINQLKEGPFLKSYDEIIEQLKRLIKRKKALCIKAEIEYFEKWTKNNETYFKDKAKIIKWIGINTNSINHHPLGQIKIKKKEEGNKTNSPTPNSIPSMYEIILPLYFINHLLGEDDAENLLTPALPLRKRNIITAEFKERIEAVVAFKNQMEKKDINEFITKFNKIIKYYNSIFKNLKKSHSVNITPEQRRYLEKNIGIEENENHFIIDFYLYVFNRINISSTMVTPKGLTYEEKEAKIEDIKKLFHDFKTIDQHGRKVPRNAWTGGGRKTRKHKPFLHIKKRTRKNNNRNKNKHKNKHTKRYKKAREKSRNKTKKR